jgi:hypothetical protein
MLTMLQLLVEFDVIFIVDRWMLFGSAIYSVSNYRFWFFKMHMYLGIAYISVQSKSYVTRKAKRPNLGQRE